jgi:hypothetical protein
VVTFDSNLSSPSCFTIIGLILFLHCIFVDGKVVSVVWVHTDLNCWQVSIDTGDLPKDWRDANISSIFKKGDKHLPETYRPVSLTSVPCKLLEHIMA